MQKMRFAALETLYFSLYLWFFTQITHWNSINVSLQRYSDDVCCSAYFKWYLIFLPLWQSAFYFNSVWLWTLLISNLIGQRVLIIQSGSLYHCYQQMWLRKSSPSLKLKYKNTFFKQLFCCQGVRILIMHSCLACFISTSYFGQNRSSML